MIQLQTLKIVSVNVCVFLFLFYSISQDTVFINNFKTLTADEMLVNTIFVKSSWHFITSSEVRILLNRIFR